MAEHDLIVMFAWLILLLTSQKQDTLLPLCGLKAVLFKHSLFTLCNITVIYGFV